MSGSAGKSFEQWGRAKRAGEVGGAGLRCWATVLALVIMVARAVFAEDAVTNSPAASPTPATNAPVVTITPLPAASEPSVSSTEHLGIGSGRLGRSIGSRGAGVELERTVTYTVSESPAEAPTNSTAAATNAAAAK